MIKLTDVSFLYGNKKAIDNISFEISGGFNVLLGPNGAGKSTLVSLLTSLYRPSSGKIFIKNIELNTNSTKADAMRIFGVVFQQSTLDLDLTVKQNLVYHGALHGLAAKQALANANEMLTTLELDQRLNDKVRSLNGGHRRRVEIVRALIHRPKILLLDEASVGLDPASRTLILKHIRALATNGNICVLWATHLFDEILAHDHVMILNNGQLEISGQVAALCRERRVDNVSGLFNLITKAGAGNGI